MWLECLVEYGINELISWKQSSKDLDSKLSGYEDLKLAFGNLCVFWIFLLINFMK